MLGIGWAEIFIIFLVGLIFIKPADLPHVAKSLAKTYRKLLNFTDSIKAEFNHVIQEADLDELQKTEFESVEARRKAYAKSLLDDHK